jgi:protein SCO1
VRICRNRFPFRSLFLAAIVFLPAVFLSSCHRASSNAKRYPFTGRVISIDIQSKTAVIDGDAIPDYMDPMAMAYKIKPAEVLTQLVPGDFISAEVVVVQPEGKAANEDAEPDYWLEDVKVTAHAKPKVMSDATQHVPSFGEEVPDFRLTDQNGKRISLKDYRGKTLLVTFIYTRCPFPDFCPRVSGKFAEIYKQIASDLAIAAPIYLLSVSFDPEHDTPKVLRDYGFSVASAHDPAIFKRWEFAVPQSADLPKIARFFGLTYNPENGRITHNLSTTVVGPDGKVVSWYHGGDWEAADLIKDATAVLAAQPAVATRVSGQNSVSN